MADPYNLSPMMKNRIASGGMGRSFIQLLMQQATFLVTYLFYYTRGRIDG